MIGSGSPSRLDETEYDAIEAALAETERGRRFLADFARRHRGADTETLLAAIRRLEGAVVREAAPAAEAGALGAIAQGVARARVAIAALTPVETGEGDAAAPDTLETFLRRGERATAQTLGAAEAIQEAAWGLREAGADAALCDVLDRHAIAIYTACSAQDLAAQRTGIVVSALCEVEAELPQEAAPAAAEPPPLAQAGPFGHDLDFVPVPAEAQDAPQGAPEPGEPEAEPGAPGDLALAFGDLDALSIEEKIALFS